MTSEAKERIIPPPIINSESKSYWDAAMQRKLMLKSCQVCHKPHFYPRALCPFCFSDQTEWIEASGKGAIYSHSTMRRGTPTPFTLAYVTLAEGPRMLTNIVDCDPDKLAIGQPVHVVFKTAEDGTPVPVWTPD